MMAISSVILEILEHKANNVSSFFGQRSSWKIYSQKLNFAMYSKFTVSHDMYKFLGNFFQH